MNRQIIELSKMIGSGVVSCEQEVYHSGTAAKPPYGVEPCATTVSVSSHSVEDCIGSHAMDN